MHVKAGWISGLGLASLGMWMASLTPIQVILPIQFQNIDARHKIQDASLLSLGGYPTLFAATAVVAILGSAWSGGSRASRNHGVRRHDRSLRTLTSGGSA
ncbi:MAG: hypothetical protein ACRDOK_02860 [Streptosporangiaceae bacterium]